LVNEDLPERAERLFAQLPSCAFHEPVFVTWWLSSLYLFPVADQLQIAMGLRSAVDIADVREEIDAFISLIEDAPENRPHDSVPVAVRPMQTAARVIVWAKLEDLYAGNPTLVLLGGLGIVLVTGKGFWFVATELVRIVF
jgi:hypothetical protein